MSRLFSQRAALYQHLDLHLAPQTRFFGAAALVNRALAELHGQPWARWCAGAAAWGLLLQIGARLERVNLKAGERLLAHRRQGLRARCDVRLDEALVNWEQRQVELLLRKLRALDAATHQRALMRIDRLFRWATRAQRPREGAWPSASASVCQALRAVGVQLGRAASFGVCEDRRRIGRAIIVQLRSGNYCLAVPGSAIFRCISASVDSGATAAAAARILLPKPWMTFNSPRIMAS